MAVARKPAPKAEAAKAAPAPVLAPVAQTAVPAAAESAATGVEAVMRKSAEQTIAGAREAQEQFRKAVEQGIAQSRTAYDKLKVAAEEATGSIESSYSAATKGVNDLNAKAIDAIKAQSEATLEHVKAVMAAKSVSEAIQLQSAHMRAQFEAFTAQAKDMAALAQKIANDASEPLKATFAKGFAA